MKHNACRLWIISLMAAIPLFAQLQLGHVSIHGFISQGYIRTSDNNYLTMKTSKGSYEVNEAAVNFSTTITDKLHGGLQLLSRDMGKVGNNTFFLDWAYADYRFQDYLGIRLGKIKTPLALYNEIRDVDALRTFILLPQSVYDENVRDFSFAFQGAALYGVLPFGVAGDMEYNLYCGTFNIPDPNTGFWYDSFANVARDIEPILFDQNTTVTKMDITNLDVTAEYICGGSGYWNTPLSGLKMGGCYLYGSIYMGSDIDAFALKTIASEITNEITRTHIDADIKIKDYYTLSGEFTAGQFILTGEYHSRVYQTRISIPEKGLVNEKDYRLEGYYGQVVFRPNDWLELGSYYSQYFDKDSQMPGEPDWFYYQKDLCFTTRFDITPQWLIKLEVHQINGVGQVLQFENPSGRKQNWNLFAIKSSLNF